jgi:hypothetical protein
MTNNDTRTLQDMTITADCLPDTRFNELINLFTLQHFSTLQADNFPFYRTTFWYPYGRRPETTFENVIEDLRPVVRSSAKVVGVEWWFSVVSINATPRWLLPCHFDRNDLDERDVQRIVFPEWASVLFLNAVPYGELVVTDQVINNIGNPTPREPGVMRFVHPSPNQYALFPGQLYHGVIGRMWLPMQPDLVRVTMSINWWTEKPKGGYMRDSREAMAAFGLR